MCIVIVTLSELVDSMNKHFSGNYVTFGIEDCSVNIDFWRRELSHSSEGFD